MHIGWRTEYALGSDHLTIILSITHTHTTWDLVTHTTPQKTFNNFRKADWASFKDGIELKPKKQQRLTNIYQAEKTLMKDIKAAAGRHIPQGRNKTQVANFPSEAVNLSEKR